MWFSCFAPSRTVPSKVAPGGERKGEGGGLHAGVEIAGARWRAGCMWLRPDRCLWGVGRVQAALAGDTNGYSGVYIGADWARTMAEGFELARALAVEIV